MGAGEEFLASAHIALCVLASVPTFAPSVMLHEAPPPPWREKDFHHSWCSPCSPLLPTLPSRWTYRKAVTSCLLETPGQLSASEEYLVSSWRGTVILQNDPTLLKPFWEKSGARWDCLSSISLLNIGLGILVSSMVF